MYLHLGSGAVVPTESIVGVFDLDNTSQSHITRKYLTAAEKSGQVINVAEDIPKSFVVPGLRRRAGVFKPDGDTDAAEKSKRK